MQNKSLKRIVIIGSAGVGKTSLLNEIKKSLSLKVIPEQARVICKELGYKNIYEIKDPTKFRSLTLKKQIKLEEKFNQFISDRSTIDCWVHWIRWSWCSRKTFESEKYFKLAYSQALKYSHIIYIPRLFKPKDDGFRWNDEEYQNQIDRLFKQLLLEWEMMNKTYIVNSKELKERLKEIKDYLKD
ncbi:MAG: ATP-binding protein [Candidatus Melainabacteria bacterium]|nr:ATP-binding protein [Candidatus Melainabacteria bacterium]